MSVTTRSVLKGYFQTGSVPTQANFADFIDSCLIPDAQGNVGLGVATPAAKLDVAGTVNATAFTGSGAGLTGIPVAALTGTLSVPAANVTGVLGASQLPPLSALSGTLTAAQLPPGVGPSGAGGGVASSVQMSNGASITGANTGILLQAANAQQTVQAYTSSLLSCSFSPGNPLGYPVPGTPYSFSGGFVASASGQLTALHLPFNLMQELAQAGVTVQLTGITVATTGATVFPPNGGGPCTATALTTDPVVVMPHINQIPAVYGSGSLYYFQFASLDVPVQADTTYNFTCAVSVTNSVSTGGWPPMFFTLSSGLGQWSLGCTAVIATVGAGNLTVLPNGVGIGTSAPSQALEVAGTVKCAGIIQTSDARLKTEVAPLDGVLPRLAALSPVTFRWAAGAFPAAAAAGPQLGLIAQAVESVFPELVQTDERGFKAMDYSRLAAVLVGATRELAAENTALRGRLGEIERRLARLEPQA